MNIQQYTTVEFIHDTEEIANYYALANKVMQKTFTPQMQSVSSSFLAKQEGWVAICAEEYWRYSTAPMLKTIQSHGYTELKSVSLDMLEPIVMKFQATDQCLDHFLHHSLGWTLLFAGEPDWIILFPHPDDFWLIAGKPDFVEGVLGRKIEKAFAKFEQKVAAYQSYKSTESREYQYFSYLLYQLREAYPAAQVGDFVGFGLS